MNNFGQADVPTGSFTQVSAGAWHSCGLLESGEAECWGDDRYEQSSPLPGPFLAVSAGTRHSCGLRAHGPVCWGERSDRLQETSAAPAGGSGDGGTNGDSVPPPDPIRPDPVE